MAEAETGMAKADLKRLLAKSKQEPVNAAFALGSDPSLGLLMLDKIKQPRAVLKLLEKDFPDLKNPRFGTAHVDVDTNPKLVKFIVNRQVSGMARRLAKTLRGTGFSKVEILLEDSTTVDSYSGADDEDEAAPEAVGQEEPAEAEAAQAGAPDVGLLQRRLAGLVPRIAAIMEASQKAELAKLANAANVALKSGAAAQAEAAIEALEGRLEGGVAQGAGPGAGPAAGRAGDFPAAWKQAEAAWKSANETVDGQIGKLQQALRASDDDDLVDIAEKGLNGVTGGTKVRLMAVMRDVGSQGGAVPKGTLDKAAKAVAAFRQQITADERVAACDTNPFGVQVSIRATFAPALEALDKTLRSAMDSAAR